MAQITQTGALNTAALVVPDVYVQIATPQALDLNGAATNILGVVGTASWGPLNQPVLVGGMAQHTAFFGPLVARQYDMGTMVACAMAQGASALVGVRVSDGTDTAGNYALLYNATTNNYPMLLTAIHTGSLGNQIALALSAGSRPGTWKLVLQLPGTLGEVFDNIDASAGPQGLWTNLVTAINSGNGPLRGPSALCVATLGSGTTTVPQSVVNQTLIGGTDGAQSVTSSQLTGEDGLTRTGMYALRGRGCSVGLLADCDDPTQWPMVSDFALSEGVYMIACGPSGDNINTAVQTKQSSGVDSYGMKIMFGDWLYWQDTVNGLVRLVSPLGFVGGILASLSPEQSSLNKPLAGIIGSQSGGLAANGQSSSYSSAELQALFSAGIDVICNPAPGGSFWAVRCGHNSSSNPVIATDSYTRMTNFLSRTLAAGMGGYVGQVINSTLLGNIRATLLAYLSNLLGQGILGTVDGSVPYAVLCGASNNPQSRTALGYVQADIQVQYQGINEKFIVNLQGGQNVTVTSVQGGTVTAS